MKNKLSVRMVILFVTSFVLVLTLQAYQGIKGYVNNYIVMNSNQNYFNSIQEAYHDLNSLIVKSNNIYDQSFKEYIDQFVQQLERYSQKSFILDADYNVVFESELNHNYIDLIEYPNTDKQNTYYIDLSMLSDDVKRNIIDSLKDVKEARVDISGIKTEKKYYSVDGDKVRDIDGRVVGEVSSHGEMMLADSTWINNKKNVQIISPTYLAINGNTIIDGDTSNMMENLLLDSYSDDDYLYGQGQTSSMYLQYNLINQNDVFDDVLEKIKNDKTHGFNKSKIYGGYEFIPLEIDRKYYLYARLPIYNGTLNDDTDETRKGYMIFLLYYPKISSNMTLQYVKDNAFTYSIALILAVLLSWLCTKIIVDPIKKIQSVAKKIENHDFDEKLKIKDSTEIGSLADSINEMSDKLKNTMSSLENEIELVRLLEKTRKEFVANFTHEMKTPIAIINGYSELIEETEDEEKRKQYLKIIDAETQKINKLVKSMLELSKLELHKVDLKLEDVDIESLLTKIIDSYECLLKDKHILVEMNIKESIIHCDEEQMQSVFTNMISNAIHHVKDHGKIKIELSLNEFSIENEGEQISNDRLETLWNAFESGHKQGTGLGLAICKNILDLHGFHYDVINSNDGVKFRIFFN